MLSLHPLGSTRSHQPMQPRCIYRQQQPEQAIKADPNINGDLTALKYCATDLPQLPARIGDRPLGSSK